MLTIRSCYTQAHLYLRLQLDNMAYLVPKPNSQATLKSCELELFISSHHPRLLGHTR